MIFETTVRIVMDDGSKFIATRELLELEILRDFAANMRPVNKVLAIKMIRMALDLCLKEAKDFVEQA
jgi:ribosomal protein L7/L12